MPNINFYMKRINVIENIVKVVFFSNSFPSIDFELQEYITLRWFNSKGSIYCYLLHHKRENFSDQKNFTIFSCNMFPVTNIKLFSKILILFL